MMTYCSMNFQVQSADENFASPSPFTTKRPEHSPTRDKTWKNIEIDNKMVSQVINEGWGQQTK